jgi:hypothetical protein
MKNNKELYSEIETLIIRWNIDGTKTAGSLTREIMQLIEAEESPSIIDEAYKKYCDHFTGYDDVPTKEAFIVECETNSVFRQVWIKD